jgi:hypothetical protein
MKLRLHACLWLGLALCCCDKTKQAGTPEEKQSGAPRATRTERPPREVLPDARKDLRAALTSAMGNGSAEERDKAIAKVAWDALELDPELALEAMDQLPPDGAERIELTRHLAMRKAEENVDEALKWAAALGTETEKAAAFGHIALVLSDSDPQRAAELLSESGIAGRGFDVVVVQVLGRWAEKSPADAAAWVVAFPPGKSREAGIRTVIYEWAGKDARATFSWMGTVKDEAIRKETSLAMAATLLQQPEDVRKTWLGHADSKVRGEVEAQWEAARKEAGEFIRPPSD